MSADPRTVCAVVDCMMLLQGTGRRESPAGMCLLLVELGAIELCISKEIVDEIRDVLSDLVYDKTSRHSRISYDYKSIAIDSKLPQRLFIVAAPSQIERMNAEIPLTVS
jgi:hypothetical protein